MGTAERTFRGPCQWCGPGPGCSTVPPTMCNSFPRSCMVRRGRQRRMLLPRRSPRHRCSLPSRGRLPRPQPPSLLPTDPSGVEAEGRGLAHRAAAAASKLRRGHRHSMSRERVIRAGETLKSHQSCSSSSCLGGVAERPAGVEWKLLHSCSSNWAAGEGAGPVSICATLRRISPPTAAAGSTPPPPLHLGSPRCWLPRLR